MVDFRYPNLIRRAKVHIIMWKTKSSCIDSSTFMLFYRLIVSIVIYRWERSHAASPKGKEEASPPTPLRMLKPPPAPPKGREGASPPSPLRMERGVNTTISKQRGRFFTSKRCPFHGKETPSSNEEGRFFVFSSAIPANEGQLCNTETIWYIAFSKPLLQTEVIIILNYELWILN